MDMTSIAARVETMCRERGMDAALTQRIISEVVTPAMRDCSAQVEQSHVELQQLRAERDRMAEVQAEVMKLVGAPKPEKILHDLRNVLNELALLRPLVGNE